MLEKNLIFLISQPRSGSTLTQKILGAHSEIYTRSEPWIMFASAYTLKKNGSTTDYDFTAASLAIEDFISNIPSESNDFYLQAVREMHLKLYGKYIEKNSKKYFLDKTPRYYLIVDELKQIFPKAKQIILIRNPLAVLSSMLTTWVRDDYQVLKKLQFDLVQAIDVFIDILQRKKDEYCIVYYEQILSNQEKVFQNIFRYLEMPYEEEIFNYHDNKEKMLYGDPINIYKNKEIMLGNDDKWIDELESYQQWQFLYDYLLLLGESKINALGYSYGDLHTQLIEKKQHIVFDEKLKLHRLNEYIYEQ